MTGVIYLHRSKTESLVYIGQTMYFEERWEQHVLAAFIGSTTRFHQAIRRLGPSDFSCEILARANSRDELNGLEKFYIAEYRAMEPKHGYNIRTGGSSNAPVTPEEATVSIDQKSLQGEAAFRQLLPLYNCYGERLGDIRIRDALEMHGTFLQLRAKGTGRRRRFVSAKLYARRSWHWAVKPSDGFSVLQLIRN